MALFGKEKKKKKKANWKLRLGIPFFLIVVLIWYGFQPIKGTQEYALCKVFIELQIKYPHSLKILQVSHFQREERVHYVYVGPFGERKIEMMACAFSKDPQTGLLKLDYAKLNRENMPEEQIRGFNMALPYIQKMDIAKNLPRKWDGTYAGLKDE